VDVHAANIQDRDGAETLLRQARRRFPFIERVTGDGGYQGPKMTALVARTGSWKLEIVKRSDLHHFLVLPKRWIVERPWHGSAAIDVWHATTSGTPAKLPPLSVSP